jgi:hypothetical protein
MTVRISFFDRSLDIPKDKAWQASIQERGSPCDILLIRPEEFLRLDDSVPEDCTKVVICPEGESLPVLLSDGLVDDLISYPIRRVDMFRLLATHEQAKAFKAIESSTKALPVLIKQIEKDLALAEKVQRRFIKEKFPPIAGISIKSKYLSGLKAGGDYFDIQEIEGTPLAVLLMADASSYSVSTALLSAVLESSSSWAKLSLNDPEPTFARLLVGPYEKMKEKDHLHFFCGVLNRKTMQLRYVLHGDIRLGVSGDSSGVRWLEERNPVLRKDSAFGSFEELLLEPGHRLLLASDGWENCLGSNAGSVFGPLFSKEKEPMALMTDLLFRLRKKVGEGEEEDEEDEIPLPSEDCSLLLLDVGRNVLRLTTNKE